MRTLKQKQKGSGLLQDMRKGLLNFFSGRRAIKSKYKTYKLNKEQKKEIERLEKKKNITEKEKKVFQNLQTLSKTKLAPTENNLWKAYEKRTKYQRWLNRFYPSTKKNLSLILPSRSYEPLAYGIYQHPENTRKNLRLENLSINNSQLNIGPLPRLGMSEAYRVNDPNQTPYIIESQAEVELRVIPILFKIWYERKYRKSFPYTTVKDIPENLYQELISDIQTKKDAADVATALFGKSLDDMNNLIQIEELGKEEEKVKTKEIGGKQRDFFTKLVQKNGETYVAGPGSVWFDRYISRIILGKKDNLYLTEFNASRCAMPLEENDFGETFKPLTSFKSHGCISIFRGTKGVIDIMKENLPAAILFKNWVVLDESFIPFNNKFERVYASKFLKLGFVQDAIDNWGLIGMDPLLYQMMLVRHPDILFKNSSYLVAQTEFPKFEQSILKNNQNFMILDSKIYTGKKEIILQNPFHKREGNELFEIFQRAVELGYLYGMTPYMTYMLKKLNPMLWILMVTGRIQRPQNNPAVQHFTVYTTLTPVEKITVDFLQYLRFMDILHEQEQAYNYVAARDSYKDSFGLDIVNLYNEQGAANRRELKRLQKIVLNKEPGDDKQTQQFILTVLKKFINPSLFKKENIVPTPMTMRKTKTEFAPVQTRNTARMNLLREQANILHGPSMVTSEGLFKTRTQALNNLTQKAVQQTNVMNKLKTLKNREQLKKSLNRAENIGAILEGKLPPNEIQREYNALKKNSNLFNAKGTRKNRNAVKRFYNNRVALERSWQRKLNILKKREAHMKKFALLELVEQKLKTTA